MKIGFVYQPEYFYFNTPKDLPGADVVHFKLLYNQYSDIKEWEDIKAANCDTLFIYRPDLISEQGFDKIQEARLIGIYTEQLPRLVNGELVSDRNCWERLVTLINSNICRLNKLIIHDEKELPILETLGVKNIIPTNIIPLNKALIDSAEKSNEESRKKEKEWDFLFLGHMNEYRHSILDLLKVNYRCLYIDHGIENSQQLKVLVQSSRFCLNVHSGKNITREVRIPYITSLGGKVLTEETYEDEYYWRTFQKDWIYKHNIVEMAERMVEEEKNYITVPEWLYMWCSNKYYKDILEQKDDSIEIIRSKAIDKIQMALEANDETYFWLLQLALKNGISLGDLWNTDVLEVIE